MLLDWNGKHPIFGTGWRPWQLARPGNGIQAQGRIRLLETPPCRGFLRAKILAAAGQGERDEMLQLRAEERSRR